MPAETVTSPNDPEILSSYTYLLTGPKLLTGPGPLLYWHPSPWE